MNILIKALQKKKKQAQIHSKSNKSKQGCHRLSCLIIGACCHHISKCAMCQWQMQSTYQMAINTFTN